MNKKLTGTILAAAVAGFFASGQAIADHQEQKQEAGEKVCCSNSCKGKSACAGADHSCAGKNACAGKGWVKSSAEQCAKDGGKVVECPK